MWFAPLQTATSLTIRRRNNSIMDNGQWWIKMSEKLSALSKEWQKKKKKKKTSRSTRDYATVRPLFSPSPIPCPILIKATDHETYFHPSSPLMTTRLERIHRPRNSSLRNYLSTCLNKLRSVFFIVTQQLGNHHSNSNLWSWSCHEQDNSSIVRDPFLIVGQWNLRREILDRISVTWMFDGSIKLYQLELE